MEKICCPVCGAASKMRYDYSRERCIAGYQHLYKDIPKDLDIIDYQLYQCSICKLVFANPMKAGGQDFYTWITKHPGYYASKKSPRWEWRKIKEYIPEDSDFSILEIGCGEGDFLEYILEDHPKCKMVGIDTTLSSCMACEKKGLEVYSMPLEEYAIKHQNEYDMVVAFHCVEHVENPLGFVKNMLECMKQNGKCIISFPYSELRIENCFTSSNNMPPHHMTRWNIDSCKMLAQKVGCDLYITCPDAYPILKEIKKELKNIYFPLWEHNNISNFRFFSHCITHLAKTIKVMWVTLTRDRVEVYDKIDGEKSMKKRMPWFVMLVLQKKQS